MGIVYYNIHYGSVGQCHTKMANYSVLLVYTMPIPHCYEPFYTGAYICIYIYSIECPKPGVLDLTRGPHTAHYVQLRHFIYYSPSSASTEGEYGILEAKFHDGGNWSVLRRQWVLLLPPSISG